MVRQMKRTLLYQLKFFSASHRYDSMVAFRFSYASWDLLAHVSATLLDVQTQGKYMSSYTAFKQVQCDDAPV